MADIKLQKGNPAVIFVANKAADSKKIFDKHLAKSTAIKKAVSIIVKNQSPYVRNDAYQWAIKSDYYVTNSLVEQLIIDCNFNAFFLEPFVQILVRFNSFDSLSDFAKEGIINVLNIYDIDINSKTAILTRFSEPFTKSFFNTVEAFFISLSSSLLASKKLKGLFAKPVTPFQSSLLPSLSSSSITVIPNTNISKKNVPVALLRTLAPYAIKRNKSSVFLFALSWNDSEITWLVIARILKILNCFFY